MNQDNVRKMQEYIKDFFALKGTSFKTKLFELYRFYSLLEIKNIEDLSNSPAFFHNFLLENIELIKKYSNENEHEILTNIYSFNRLLESKLSSENQQEQGKFVEIVNNITPKKNDYHILDVGPGNLAYSSILLGSGNPKVSAMDESFWLDDRALGQMNVNPLTEYFDKKTMIADYDMIVGKTPCSAIDSIVYLCAKYKKPYFIETCDCYMPSMQYFYRKWCIEKSIKKVSGDPKFTSGRRRSRFDMVIDFSESKGDEWFGWKDMLPELDRDISFSGRFAYNIGESKDNVDSLVADYQEFEKELYRKILNKEIINKANQKLKFDEIIDFGASISKEDSTM